MPYLERLPYVSLSSTTFYDELSLVVKQLDSQREIIWYWEFIINWSDKHCRQRLKAIMAKFNYQQMIKGPTRVTRQIKTLIELVFSNKPERITRTYNLITGLSDHNMTLTARKLTRNACSILVNLIMKE